MKYFPRGVETDDARVRRACTDAVAARLHRDRYGARSWHRQRRVAVRIEATPQGPDVRYVVTNFESGSAKWLYDTLFCARGHIET